MSNGGGESGRELGHNNNSKKKSNNEFVQSIAKIAVAQVCESTGFQGFQQSALNTLSDIVVRYISHIGRTANSYANLSGRRESNVFDIIQGLQDLGMLQGFSGASELNRCLAGSGTIQEIGQYLHVAEEIPFAYTIPDFPVIKESKLTPTFEQTGETPPSEHIPAWLPAFPDPEACTCFKSRIELGDGRIDYIDQAKDYESMEESQLNMQRRVACNGSEMPLIVDRGDASSSRQVAESNPFTVPPLRFREKEVSTFVLPAKLFNDNVVQIPAYGKTHISLLDTYVPRIDVVKSSVYDSNEDRKKVLLDSRSNVKFKFGLDKKSLGTAVSPLNEKSSKTASFVGNDNLKDDIKRRAKKILKESKENPLELNQLQNRFF